jgi:hypothetical protein
VDVCDGGTVRDWLGVCEVVAVADRPSDSACDGDWVSLVLIDSVWEGVGDGEREDDGERERLVDAVSEGVRETLSEAVAV